MIFFLLQLCLLATACPSLNDDFKNRNTLLVSDESKLEATEYLVQSLIDNNQECFVEAVTNGADLGFVTDSGLNALHISIDHGSCDIVRLVLAADDAPNVDEPDSSGLTPLHHSIRTKGIECTCALLSAGADPNIRDNSGRTVIHTAIYSNAAPSQIEPLLSGSCGRVADVAALYNGKSVLHLSVLMHDSILVEYFLQQELVDPDGLDSDRNTALILAIRNGDKQCVEALLNGERHASVSTRDKEGFTPLHNAVKLGQYSLIQTLLQAGADPCDFDNTEQKRPIEMAPDSDANYAALREASQKCPRNCPAGTQATGEGECTQCPVGTYKSSPGPVLCMECSGADIVLNTPTQCERCSFKDGYYLMESGDCGDCKQFTEGQMYCSLSTNDNGDQYYEIKNCPSGWYRPTVFSCEECDLDCICYGDMSRPEWHFKWTYNPKTKSGRILISVTVLGGVLIAGGITTAVILSK